MTVKNDYDSVKKLLDEHASDDDIVESVGYDDDNKFEYVTSHSNSCTSSPYYKYPITTAASVLSISAIALKIIDPWSISHQPISSTLLTFCAAAGVQYAFQTIAPDKVIHIEKNIIADYSAFAFLIGTQVYLNLNQTKLMKEIFFTAFTATYGIAIAALVDNLVKQKWRVEEFRSESGYIDEAPYSKLKTLFPLSTKSRVPWSLLKILVGFSIFGYGITTSKPFLFKDFGALVSGDGIFQLVHEFVLNRINSKKKGNIYKSVIGLMETNEEMPLYLKVRKISLVFSNILPGILISAAATSQLAKTPHLVTSLLWALVGGLDGTRRLYEQLRFTETKANYLYELKHEPIKYNCFLRTVQVAHFLVAAILLPTFIGLTIAGFDPQTAKFTKPPLFDQIAPSVFLGSVYSSYLVAEFAKRKLRLDENWRSFFNTLYFYTHYSPGIPMVALYLITKIKIGDEALNHSTTLAGVVASIAYFSLGWGIGNMANNMGVIKGPRTFTPLASALIGQYFADRIFSVLRFSSS